MVYGVSIVAATTASDKANVSMSIRYLWQAQIPLPTSRLSVFTLFIFIHDANIPDTHRYINTDIPESELEQLRNVIRDQNKQAPMR